MECYKGEATEPFKKMSIPKNLTKDSAKNLCVYYASNLQFI
jgi:hypothetical protein